MKKLLISMLLLIAMIVNCFALASCNLLPGNDDTTGGNEEEEGKINITFYHTMGENLRTVLDYYIEEFEALYPDINIIHEQVGGYDDVRDQISTELTVGNQPNIAYCYPDHVALYNVAKAVCTLDDFINSTEVVERANGTTEVLGLTAEQIADFIPAYYEEGKQFGDGKMYTLPLSKSTEVLYYNKTFFDANGLTVPTTWDEMEALCARILEIDPDSTPLGYDSEANWFITMCEQLETDYTTATGDEKFLFNNAENKEFAKRFREWYVKGYVTTQEIYGGYTSGLFTSNKTEKSYMSIGSSAGATHQRPAKDDATGKYPFEVGIASIPQENKENPKVISQGPSLCIFENADPAEERASWLFVKFLTTNVAFQAEFSEASGYVPVIKSVSNDADYQKFLAGANGTTGIAALSAKVCLEQVDAYYTSPAFNGSSTAREQVGILLQAVLLIPAETQNVDAEIDKLFKAAYDKCKYEAG